MEGWGSGPAWSVGHALMAHAPTCKSFRRKATLLLSTCIVAVEGSLLTSVCIIGADVFFHAFLCQMSTIKARLQQIRANREYRHNFVSKMEVLAHHTVQK